jgi:hypothetical protein
MDRATRLENRRREKEDRERIQELERENEALRLYIKQAQLDALTALSRRLDAIDRQTERRDDQDQD